MCFAGPGDCILTNSQIFARIANSARNVVRFFHKLCCLDSREAAITAEQAHTYVDHLAKLLELAGGVILAGIIIAASIFLRFGVRSGDWRTAYEQFRSNLGRGILLGLELLVGADIISTITSPITPESVGLLGAIVGIRTFLSFSLETEIEGCWPWQRAAKRAKTTETPSR